MGRPSKSKLAEDKVKEKFLVKTGSYFSEDQKREAVRILAANNYNYSLTEKAINVTRKTLKKWQEELADDPDTNKKKTQDLVVIGNTLVQNTVSTLDKIKEVKIKALDRALVLLDKETNLDKVVNLIVALQESENDPLGDNKDGFKGKRITVAERIERLTNIQNE